jgi:hypothetical protein
MTGAGESKLRTVNLLTLRERAQKRGSRLAATSPRKAPILAKHHLLSRRINPFGTKRENSQTNIDGKQHRSRPISRSDMAAMPVFRDERRLQVIAGAERCSGESFARVVVTGRNLNPS